MVLTRLKTIFILLVLTLALTLSFFVGPLPRAAAATPDFTISASPTSQTIQRGGTAVYNIQITALNGFNGTVTLTDTDPFAKTVPSFSSTTVTGSGTVQFNVFSNGHQTPTGTATLTVTGTSGSLQHSVQVKLTVIPVPDFSISSNPFVQTVKPGGTAVYQISVTSVPGTNFSGTVTLAVSGVPASASASFTSTSVVVPGTSELDIKTTSQTTTGSFGLTVTGTSGQLGHFTDITFEVIPPNSNFTLSASPTSQSIQRGGLNAVYTIHVGALNGFIGTVNFTVSGVPANDLGFFNPDSVAGSGDVDFIFNSGAQSSLGTFTLTVTGTSGPLQHSIQVTCTVTQ